MGRSTLTERKQSVLSLDDTQLRYRQAQCIMSTDLRQSRGYSYFCDTIYPAWVQAAPSIPIAKARGIPDGKLGKDPGESMRWAVAKAE
jgi:hypothetical protein